MKKHPVSPKSSNLDQSSQKGKHTRGTKGEQMRTDAKSRGLTVRGGGANDEMTGKEDPSKD